MKQRFSSLDVKVIAHELSNALCSLRLSNAYDLSSRIFLLKFAKPNYKEQLVIDSGFRCHLTKFARTTATEPSAFVARLRKFLKTRRVTSVSQVGTDRVISLQFSDGQYRLFLEFFAGGNIILTDKELKILALLRIVPPGEGQEELRVGLDYSLKNRQNYGGVPPLTRERLQEGLRKALIKSTENADAGKKRKSKPGDTLRKALATSLTEFPPMLLDHAFRLQSFDQSKEVVDILNDSDCLDALMRVLKEAQKVMADITSAEIAKGYIVAKPIERRSPKDGQVDVEDQEFDKENVNLMYEDFHPFRPSQFEGLPNVRILEFDGFNVTVDEFFSSIESQKLESRLTEREEQAKKRLKSARTEHAKRVGGLQQVQELNVRKAQAIEGNVQRVEETIMAVNGLIAQGMDWVEVARLIEMEQARHNAVAEIIKLPLKLYENTVTILLAEEAFDEDDFEGDETDSEVADSDEETKKPAKTSDLRHQAEKRLEVDVDLGLSPWANARNYYDQKKTAAVKEQKTIQSSAMALKSTEQRVNADLKKALNKEKEVLRPVRRQLWFEKFFYFISSEGYLVIAGHDAQQNDILYQRYLGKGDVYVHADVQGATSVIVKNKRNLVTSPIPPSTLLQAGTLSVATSVAWTSKAIMAAWWVEYDQVSKLDSTGDYLGIGLFTIKGKKNFLPPAQLLLGFGIMFQISSESKAKHLKHRIPDSDATVGATAKDVVMTEETVSQPGSVGEKVKSEYEQIHVQSDDDNGDDNSAPDSDTELEAYVNDDDPGKSYNNPLQTSRLESDFKGLSIEESKRPLQENEHSSEEDEDLDRVHEPTPDITIKQSPNPAGATPLSEAVSATSKDDKQAVQVRGKRGKQSKMKTKYAHQDEEDRILAMRLLGSNAAQQKATSEAESQATKAAELAAQKERRRQQHLQTQKSGKEAETARQTRIERGSLEMLDEEEAAQLDLVENFVGTPLPGDEILDCLVVCGPWDALGAKLRWRVKMQPGGQKKGKAVKEILAGWAGTVAALEKRKKAPPGEEGHEEERMYRREGELVKNLRDVEVIGVVPVGMVRLVGGAGVGGVGDKGKGTAKGGKKSTGKGNRGGRGSKK